MYDDDQDYEKLDGYKKKIQGRQDHEHKLMSNLLKRQISVIQKMISFMDTNLSQLEDTVRNFRQTLNGLQDDTQAVIKESQVLINTVHGDHLSRVILERMNEVQKQKILENTKKLQNKIEIDELTGIKTRNFFEHFLQTQLSFHHRNNIPLVFLMIDLDNFKKINDTKGHQIGDDVLRITGEIFRKILRESDIAARYGGDEFMILLQQTSLEESIHVITRIHFIFNLLFCSPEENKEILQKLTDDINEKKISSYEFNYILEIKQFFEKKTEYSQDLKEALNLLTVSMGVTVRFNNDDMDSIVNRADKALYESKKRGRNKVSFIEPGDGALSSLID